MFALPYLFEITRSVRNRLLHSTAVKFSRQNTACRPPNILIYTGKVDQNSRKFLKTKEILQQCLHQDKYVIYQLKHDLILQEPWVESTALLVLNCEEENLVNSHKELFDNFVQKGGKFLGFSKWFTLNDAVSLRKVDGVVKEVCLSEDFEENGRSLRVSEFDTTYEVKNNQKNIKILAVCPQTSQPSIISISHGYGVAILCTAQLPQDSQDERLNSDTKGLLKLVLEHIGMTCGVADKPVLTIAYLLAEDEVKETFLRSIQDKLTDNCFKENNMSILFTEDKDIPTSNSVFPLLTNALPDEVSFSFPLYKENLETKHLGHLVIYTEIITSTQTILNGSLRLWRDLPECCGLVLVGRQQITGKGRGGNTWLSPDGCLSFSFPLHVDIGTHLGRRLPFIQHVAALAVVEAVRAMHGYEDIDLRIKWPNDIYFGKDTKIGGVLVTSSLQGTRLHALIGIGINLDNSEPTTCINDMVEQQNIISNITLEKLPREQLLARILNEMESIVEAFQEFGLKSFLQKYYLRWLHSGAKVNLENENGELVTVRGLDDMGFLSVVNSLDEVQSVQPDGNSFDMMRNLISIKAR